MKGFKQGGMLRVLSAASLAALALPAAAVDYTVTTTADAVVEDGDVSLREAILAANGMAPNNDVVAGDADGDTITIGNVAYPITSVLAITDDVTITGGANSSIDGGGATQLITVDADGETVALSTMTLTNGTAVTGAAIQIAMGSTVTLTDVDVTDNVGTGAAVTNGGAIDNAGTLEITGGTFSGNTASVGQGSGGAIHNWGTLTATGTTFDSNDANRAGGAIEQRTNDASMTLTNVTMTGNTTGPATPIAGAPGNGGGVHISQAGDADINGGSYTGNIAANEGGALWNGGGEMTVDDASITNNDANGTDAFAGGGGLFNQGGTLIVTNTTITGNTAAFGSGSGGGIFNNAGGDLTVTGGVISANVAARAGGGIEDRAIPEGAETVTPGTITLTDVTMERNGAGVDADDAVTTVVTAAPGNGGAFHATGGVTLVVSGLTVTDNVAALEGGGIWTGSGTSTITDTSFSGNSAQGAAFDNAGPGGASGGGGGLFNETGTVTVSGNTTFDANTATTGQGSGGAVLNNNGTMTFTGTTFTNNVANRAGGGIEDRQSAGDGSVTLTLTNITATSNSAQSGDGVAGAPGNGGFLHVTGNAGTAISGGSFTGNVAALEGGALWTGGGDSTIADATISGNTASGDAADDGGGGLFNQGGTVTITGTTVISGNQADGAAGSGGGIFNNGGAVLMTDTEISGNVANRAGGGIEDLPGSGMFTAMNPSISMTNVTLSGNGAGASVGDLTATAAPGNGGGLHITNAGGTGVGWVAVSGGAVMNNTAGREGGGLWNHSDSTMTVDGTSITGNIALGTDASQGGGGLFNSGGTMTVTGATIAMNTANEGQGSGGGLMSKAGTVEITGTTFEANTANRAGGAIETREATVLTLTDSTLDSNETGPATAIMGAPGNGGGIHVSGGGATTTVNRSTVSNNTAANEGGGLWNFDGSTMNVWNSTVFGNTADGAPGGGGIFNRPASITDVLNSTIAGNTATAGTGGGIKNSDDTAVFTATNMLVANNTATANNDLDGEVTGDNNLVADATGATLTGDNNITNVDTRLATALADNGGETLTLSIVQTSPATNAGDNATCAGMAIDGTDQRGEGFERPFPAGGNCDIGAFEITENPVAPMAPTTGSTGDAGTTVQLASGAQNVSAVGLTVTAPADEDLNVNGLSGSISTTSTNLGSDIASASLFLDANGNGVVDAGETNLGPVTITSTASEQSFSIDFATPRVIDAGSSESYLVAVSFSEDIAALALPMLAGGGLLMLGLIGGLRRRNQLLAIAAIVAAGGLAGCDNATEITVLQTTTSSFTFTLDELDAEGADTGLEAVPSGLPITGPTLVVTETTTTTSGG